MVFGHSFLTCLREFYFLTERDDFGKGIAFAWRPFFSNIQNGLLFLILGGHKYTLRHDLYFFGYLEFFMKKWAMFFFSYSPTRII